jgi:L-malate glycosyltransferase
MRVEVGDRDNSARGTTDPRIPGVFLMTDSFDTGGSERQFAALARSLDPALYRLHIGCLQKKGGFLDGFRDVVEFSPGGNFYNLHSLRTGLRLVRYLNRSRISIAHAFDFYTNLALIPAARLARVPIVIGSQRQLGDLLTPAKSRAQRAVLRWCDRVVCNSHAAAYRLTEQGIAKHRVVVIHNGYPPETFMPAAPALPRQPTLLRIGMIARMNTASKNHRMFLRVAARLSDRFRKLEFVLVGDGPLRPELEQLANTLGIARQCRFLGDRKDIPAILASVDVSVLPSGSESLSNVIIESMAAGIPVVASCVGGNPELINNSRGILVAPGDEKSLAACLESLLDNSSLRAELGRNAKEFAKKHFTLAEMRKCHEDLYADLLAEKTRQNPRRSVPRKNDATTGALRVAIVAASMRYVGGQSVQADLLYANWRNDPAISVHPISIDPIFPHGLKWAEKIPVLRTFVRQPFYLWALWRGLENIDIAHIFSASYWSFLVAPAPAWLIARMRGAKTLIHYHSGEARDHLRRFRSAKYVLKRADCLIVPSGYLADVFGQVGLGARVVPNIVDLSQFSFRVRKPLRPHLICTRGFHPYYRLDIVVHAFAEVKTSYPDARLDLVGSGPLEDQIRTLVKELGLRDVNFAGVALRRKIGSLYNQADIFINGSSLDNMPVSIIEAFASGSPVVSTAPEGMRYLVEHERTGLLSEPGDATALAASVIRLLQNPDLASRIAINAHDESVRYRWIEVRGQWLKIYSSMVRPGNETLANERKIARC